MTDPSTVAPLFAPNERRGIYILEFKNGERYVGQTENVVTRYSTHRHGSKHHAAWQYVTAISFCHIPEGNLDEPERITIRQQRAAHRLRNRAFNFGHWEPTVLDDYVAPEEQLHWATGHPSYDLAPFAEAAKNLKQETPKLLTKRRGQEVMPDGRPVWEVVVDELAQIVALAIPNATQTQKRFWTLSDYPSTAGGRFATLNVGSLELAFFPRHRMESDYGSWEESLGLVFRLNAEMGSFVDEESLTERERDENIYFPDQVNGYLTEWYRVPHGYSVPVDSLAGPLGVFGFSVFPEEMRAGVRSLAIHSMRKQSALLNGRSHSEPLTRMVFERIASPQFQQMLADNTSGTRQQTEC
ncbi:GIY-YIG nuclease family protein [Gleimia hominis]|uniref:GIY-YIG nuclease family protein n=1 Tax=Gleimia hominis TaxID=595468 RepID=A0ABU3I997_9ACTO|nr:GIY-YIG nuclease family protein [Gleimia hominis]MDT3766943.1 GIY-YIG nuclease family protein [Gleimia hominis]